MKQHITDSLAIRRYEVAISPDKIITTSDIHLRYS